jgi:hypothetical protein
MSGVKFEIFSNVEDIVFFLRTRISLMRIESNWQAQEDLEGLNPLITPLFFWKGEYCEYMYSELTKSKQSQEIQDKIKESSPEQLESFKDALKKTILEYRAECEKANEDDDDDYY